MARVVAIDVTKFDVSAPVCVGRGAGYEVWAAFDGSAAVWECFASPECDDYLGIYCDTLAEAREHARQWIRDRREEGFR